MERTELCLSGALLIVALIATISGLGVWCYAYWKNPVHPVIEYVNCTDRLSYEISCITVDDADEPACTVIQLTRGISL